MKHILAAQIAVIATALNVAQAQDLPADTTPETDWADSWEDSWEDDIASEPAPLLTGFLEQAIGTRLQDSPYNGDQTLFDSRARLEFDHQFSELKLTAKADVYYDAVINSWRKKIRELSAETSIGKVDLKAGRQILTWGTGDYLFLNDFFPKDWQSFFAGRDDEYLKAPSDALKISFYGDWVNLNLVWSPEFDPDNYINGEYFSFFDRQQQALAAIDFNADQPSGDEWAVRLYKNQGSNEWAIYGYDGFFKSPNAISNTNGRYTFSGLQSLGASWRRPLAQGLFNTELAYHYSKDDSQGTDPLISNSQWRFLLAYEQELITRLTGSVQLYLERTEDYQNLLENSPASELEPKQNRTVLTSRLTWRDRREKLTLSLFTFYSPSDRDAYIRPSGSYRFDDNWTASVGFNWFIGEEEHTFFGQFEDNNNIYARVRYRF